MNWSSSEHTTTRGGRWSFIRRDRGRILFTSDWWVFFCFCFFTRLRRVKAVVMLLFVLSLWTDWYCWRLPLCQVAGQWLWCFRVVLLPVIKTVNNTSCKAHCYSRTIIVKVKYCTCWPNFKGTLHWDTNVIVAALCFVVFCWSWATGEHLNQLRLCFAVVFIAASCLWLLSYFRENLLLML